MIPLSKIITLFIPLLIPCFYAFQTLSPDYVFQEPVRTSAGSGIGNNSGITPSLETDNASDTAARFVGVPSPDPRTTFGRANNARIIEIPIDSITKMQRSKLQDLKPNPKRYTFQSPHMGTLFRIILYAHVDSLAQVASRAAFQRVENLNHIMSDYLPDSELNRLSRSSGSEERMSVDEDLFQVLKHARDLSVRTGGKFDVTIGPLSHMWRALRQETQPALPSPESLKQAKKRVGYEYIKLDVSARAVKLTKPGMQLDLGGIAKGYAADEALKVLQEFGIQSALVDAGGDIVLGEAPPGESGWKIYIPSQKPGNNKLQTLRLSNRAITTSGDLFQHIEIDGKKYSHIINPKTGLGLTNATAVTVIAPDGITADSYATAISVMGPEKGLELIKDCRDIGAFIEYIHEGEIKNAASDSFFRFTRD